MKLFLNVKHFKGKALAIDPEKGGKTYVPRSIGLDSNWFGGRVKKLVEVEPGLLYCLDRNTTEVIGIYIPDIEKVGYGNLKEIAKMQGHNVPAVIKKEDLLALFGIMPKVVIADEEKGQEG